MLQKVKRLADDTMQLMFKKMLYHEQEIGKQKKLKLVMLLLLGQKSMVVWEDLPFSQLFILRKSLNIMFQQASLILA